MVAEMLARFFVHTERMYQILNRITENKFFLDTSLRNCRKIKDKEKKITAKDRLPVINW